MKSCPLCGQEILAVAVKCRHCRRYLDPHRRREEGRSAGILGNTPDRAIAAGYLGLLSLFPFVGIAFGIGAVFFGSKALRLIRDEPGRDGRGRAWTGIVLGAIGIVGWSSVLGAALYHDAHR